MIDITLGRYHIYTADRLNIVLAERRIIDNPKSKRNGETVEKLIGYYGNLEHALREYAKRSMQGDCYNATSVEMLQCTLELIDLHIMRAAKILEEDDRETD